MRNNKRPLTKHWQTKPIYIMDNKKLYFLFILTWLNVFAYAQMIKISGLVLDQQHNPISLATIKFKGGTKVFWVITHEDGRYYGIIDSQRDSVIICSHANFKTVSKKIEGNNEINFVLERDIREYRLTAFCDTITGTGPDLTENRYIDSFLLANENKIFTSVEIQPEFTGGEAGIQRYFDKNLKILRIGKMERLNGVIRANFRINKDGTTSDISIEKGVDKAIDQLVLQLIAKMPRWRPAMQNGKNCESEVKLSIPIRRIIQ